MAEHSFREVMRQWVRMCKSHSQCEGCKLSAYDEFGYAYNCCGNGIPCSADRIEAVVMSWAAEHPEPVYPTWFEVLENMGIAGRINGELYYDSQDREVYLKTPAFTPKAFDPIPADIAQKMGIEPKGEPKEV